MLAGATAINADGWGDNWVAAFRLPGQAPHWWIVAMRGAQIYEDQLHGAESAARQAMEMSLEAPDWDRIVAPPAWEIGNSQAQDVADALDLARAAPLQRVNRVARMAGIAALVMATAILAGFGWSRLAPVDGTGIASLGAPVPAVESYDFPLGECALDPRIRAPVHGRDGPDAVAAARLAAGIADLQLVRAIHRHQDEIAAQ